MCKWLCVFFFFQAEDGIRDLTVTGVQTCALPISIEFAALYIYGHLNGVGGLQPNTAIFVGELGGERPGQAKVFHPIQDLSGKSPARSWIGWNTLACPV